MPTLSERQAPYVPGPKGKPRPASSYRAARRNAVRGGARKAFPGWIVEDEMPLTSKGKEILGHLEEEYGEEKGKEVLYAGKNKGNFTGIDSDKLDSLSAACDALQQRVERLIEK